MSLEAGSLAEWVAGGLVVASGFVGYGMLRQRISDLESARAEDRVAHKEEIKRVESKADAAATMAGDVKAIPASIESMGVRLATQIEHVVEMFGLRFQHLDEKVDGLETQVRAPKRRAAASKTPKA